MKYPTGCINGDAPARYCSVKLIVIVWVSPPVVPTTLTLVGPVIATFKLPLVCELAVLTSPEYEAPKVWTPTASPVI